MKLSALFSVKTWFSVGIRRRPKGILEWVFMPFAVAVGLYVIAAATLIIISPWALTVLFFSGIGALAFLTTGATEDSDGDRPSVIDIALALICVAVGAYFAFESEVIVNRIVLLDELTFWNIVFGTIVFLLTLELTRRTTGVGLTALVLIFVAYT